MRCVFCRNGETSPGKVTVTLEQIGSTVVFRDVPAQVCENCGEEYVSGETTQTLLKCVGEAARSGVVVDLRAFAA